MVYSGREPINTRLNMLWSSFIVRLQLENAAEGSHWAKKRNNWVNITESDSLHLRNLEIGIECFFSVTDSQRIPLILRN